MTKGVNIQQYVTSLTVEQENAISLLVTGESDQMVADQVGVSRKTLSEWRSQPVFIVALNRRREGLWSEQTDRLRSLVSQAIEVLAANLENPDPKVQAAAAALILRCRADLRPDGPTSESGVLLDSLRF